jgi:Tol biopolymer transport system component
VARGADRLVYQDIVFDTDLWQVERTGDRHAGLTTYPLIVSDREASQGTYSPDGTRIAYVSTRTGNPEIWTAATDGSEPGQLTHFEGVAVGRPVWSPDGEQIAFHAHAGGFSDLYVAGATGTEPRLLTSGLHNHLMSSWSRDGSWIYFGCDRTGQWEIWRVRVVGSERNPEQMTHAGGIIGYESPDGATLYFTKPRAGGIWSLVLDRADAEPVQVFDMLPGVGEWGNWACYDGGAILVMPSYQSVILCDLDLTGDRFDPIIEVPGVAPHSIGVSQDGLSILYAQVESQVSDLMLVEDFR